MAFWLSASIHFSLAAHKSRNESSLSPANFSCPQNSPFHLSSCHSLYAVISVVSSAAVFFFYFHPQGECFGVGAGNWFWGQALSAFFSTHLWNSRVGTFGRGVLGPVRTHVLAKMELLHNFNAYLGRTSVLVILPAERSN